MPTQTALLPLIASAGGASGPLVALLVEDNTDLRNLVARQLVRLGYRVVPAADAEEALALLTASAGTPALPNVILCDLRLPGMDGCEFIRRVRKLPGLADVLAYAATGSALDEEIRAALAAGFTDCILKPINLDAVDAQVRSRA